MLVKEKWIYLGSGIKNQTTKVLKEETNQQEERIEELRKRVYCQKEYMIAPIGKIDPDYLNFNIGLDSELLENSIAAKGYDCRCIKSP